MKINKKELEAIFDYIKPNPRDGIFDNLESDPANPLLFLDEYMKGNTYRDIGAW